MAVNQFPSNQFAKHKFAEKQSVQGLGLWKPGAPPCSFRPSALPQGRSAQEPLLPHCALPSPLETQQCSGRFPAIAQDSGWCLRLPQCASHRGLSCGGRESGMVLTAVVLVLARAARSPPMSSRGSRTPQSWGAGKSTRKTPKLTANAPGCLVPALWSPCQHLHPEGF